MDIQAGKLVSIVAASPERGRPATSQVSGAGDLPAGRAPPPPVHVDPVAKKDQQDQQERSAELARRMSDFLRSISRDLVFQVDVESGDAVLTVRDAAGNIVRKIPGEEALQMLRRTNAESGTLINSVV